MNEEGKAREKEREQAALKCRSSNMEVDIRITINKIPTWIQSEKKYVEENSSQKNSPQCEHAETGWHCFSVDEPEHGF